ncbi:MAG: response regulator transcription factor [Bacillota bacterium]
MYKLLVVDDEKEIVNMIDTFLKNFNYKIIKGYSSLDALALIDKSIDLVILDIALNKEPNAGITICKKIREKYNTPIIFLTAKTNSIDQIKGFNVGADDYITKPFDLMLLASRIKAHLRRVNDYDLNKKDILKVKDLKLNTKSKRVFKGEKELSLSEHEYNLLVYLLSNKNIILSKKSILENVWKSQHYNDNNVNTSIMRLRKKLDDNKDKYIETIHSRGYIIKDS